MPKYTFYKIHLKNPDPLAINDKFNYIGMTTNLISRKSVHKQSCNNENNKHYNYNVYKNIREFGGFDAFCIEPLEEMEYDTKLDASKRERYWYDKEGGELNTCVPGQTSKEYHVIYRAEHKEQSKISNAFHNPINYKKRKLLKSINDLKE
jgi:hypothetical protein